LGFTNSTTGFLRVSNKSTKSSFKFHTLVSIEEILNYVFTKILNTVIDYNSTLLIPLKQGKSDNNDTKYYYYRLLLTTTTVAVEIGDVVCSAECELIVAELIRSGPFNPCRPHNGLLTTAKVAGRLITAHSASLC